MTEGRDLVDTILTEYERLDTCVHTAGIVPSEQEMTGEDIERSFPINYPNPFH